MKHWLGHSNISQTTFSGNEPNCLLIFIDFPSTSQINQPTLLTIVNSQMMFESTSFRSKVAGVTITLAQTAYNVHIGIHNIEITHDDFEVSIDKWVCHCSTIHVTQIASTGNHNILALLYEAIQDESAELCFIFRSARCVLYFPWKI